MRFDVVLRQDEDGYYVATVPELPGCHSQAKSLDVLAVQASLLIDMWRSWQDT